MPNLDVIPRNSLVREALACGLLYKQAVHRDESYLGRLLRRIGGPYLEIYGENPPLCGFIEDVFNIEPPKPQPHFSGIPLRTYHFRFFTGFAYEGRLPYKSLDNPEYIKSWLYGCSLIDNHFAGCPDGMVFTSRNLELTNFLKEAAASVGYKLLKEEKSPYKVINKYEEYGNVYLSYGGSNGH